MAIGKAIGGYLLVGLLCVPFVYSNNANGYRSDGTARNVGQALSGGLLFWPSYVFSFEPEIDGDSVEDFGNSFRDMLEYRNTKWFAGGSDSGRRSENRRMMEKSVCNAVIHTGLTKEQRERLESMVNQMSMVIGENLVDTDKAFHEELIADTGNNLWITLMEAVVEVYREWIDYVIKHADGIKKKKLLKTHEMIYDSLIKKDIETLNAAIDEHYDIIEELLG